jgi:quinolinate synthase
LLSYRLKAFYPEKIFYTKDEAICEDMKKNTLKDVFQSLDALQYEILLDPEVMSRARGASERISRHREMTS